MEPDFVAEYYGLRVAAMFTAYAQLDATACGLAQFYSGFDKSSNAVLVEDLEWIIVKDSHLNVVREEFSGIIA